MAGDFYFNKVALLLHCDGANNSTTFTDNSPSPKTITVGGNAKISTAQSKFGGAAAFFDGAGDYLTAPNGTAFDFGSGDWTVELWIRLAATPSAVMCLIEKWSTYGFYFNVSADGRVYGGVTNSISGTVSVSDATPMSAGAWYHVALVRAGTSIGLFKNGTLVASASGFSGALNTNTDAVNIGRDSSNTWYFNGYMDDIRITKGKARYLLAFTPPASAFGNDAFPGQRQITLAGQTPFVVSPFSATPAQAELMLTGQSPTFSGFIFYGYPIQGDINVDGNTPLGLALGWAPTPTAGQIGIAGEIPVFANRLLYAISPHWISTIYRCYLTGADDGLPDLELPISSFQTRYGTNPFRIYLSVIVPGVDSYVDAIQARPNGKLRIDRIYKYLDGSAETFVMAVAPFDSLDTNQGGKSGTTGTLSGFENLFPVDAQTIELFDPITRSNSSGKRRYRCRIDPRVRPQDTVMINSESFVVGEVIHIIDTQTSIMEVHEAAA